MLTYKMWCFKGELVNSKPSSIRYIWILWMKELYALKRELMFMKVTILSNSKGECLLWQCNGRRDWFVEAAMSTFFLIRSEQAKRLIPSERIHFEYFTFSNFLPNPHAIIACVILDFCRGRILQFFCLSLCFTFNIWLCGSFLRSYNWNGSFSL